MILALYKKELISYFKTPLAYVFLALILFFTGVIFTTGFLFRANQNFPLYLRILTTLFVVIIPLLTMRSYSEEFKNRTDQLLFTLPIPLTSILIAKFLAILTVFAVIIGNLFLYLFVLQRFGSPDWPHIIIAMIGFILLGSTLISLGMAISSYTQHQLLAALISFIAVLIIVILTSLTPIIPKSATASLLLFSSIIAIQTQRLYTKTHKKLPSIVLFLTLLSIMLIWQITSNDSFTNFIPMFLRNYSPLVRYQSFNQGILHLNDLVYFVVSIIVLQYITYLNLEKHYYKER
ncbi:ABC transporter permease [Entomospira entomophila]|uniref:ABC transporter permease n=1 Tax=Entomospira entomophila TaxID=2719988 RepID=A0A968GB60_9SPIO|nr:ABC transporter permease [Entomospira entomophilus]NIZ40166.1 hypothetical protein [Entomospira entomophilus]WDI35724.1 ABC transporter permease [Entomospira entomophilus]